MSEIELTKFEAADRELVSVAKGIKILSLVAWPPRMATDFIDGWQKKAGPRSRAHQISRRASKSRFPSWSGWLIRLRTAMRCFRGGDPKGRIAFTKDVVYFRGLVKTQAFFLKVLTEGKVETIKDLFAGRMTWDDASEFGPLFRSGSIRQPKYVPEWASALDRLAAYLAFSNLTHRLPTEEAALEVFSPLLAAYPSNLPQA